MYGLLKCWNSAAHMPRRSPLLWSICKKLHFLEKAVADSLTCSKSLWKMSSLQQAALSDTIWIFPTKRCLQQISLTILQDLKIPFGYQYAKHSTVLIWRTEDKQNREKQNKGDVSKISGKHSFATVTMWCLYSLNYPFFFFFNQCHLHLPKSFRRPKNSCRATVWQEESPIFIFSYFSRGTFSRHMETWVNKKKKTAVNKKKKFPADIIDKMYSTLNF